MQQENFELLSPLYNGAPVTIQEFGQIHGETVFSYMHELVHNFLRGITGVRRGTELNIGLVSQHMATLIRLYLSLIRQFQN